MLYSSQPHGLQYSAVLYYVIHCPTFQCTGSYNFTHNLTIHCCECAILTNPLPHITVYWQLQYYPESPQYNVVQYCPQLHSTVQCSTGTTHRPTIQCSCNSSHIPIHTVYSSCNTSIARQYSIVAILTIAPQYSAPTIGYFPQPSVVDPDLNQIRIQVLCRSGSPQVKNRINKRQNLRALFFL